VIFFIFFSWCDKVAPGLGATHLTFQHHHNLFYHF
jgi:hypothetical protein